MVKVIKLLFIFFLSCNAFVNTLSWDFFYLKVDDLIDKHKITHNNIYAENFSRGHSSLNEQRILIQQLSVYIQYMLITKSFKLINSPKILNMYETKRELLDDLGFRYNDYQKENIYNNLTSEFEMLYDIAKLLDIEFDELGKIDVASKSTIIFCNEIIKYYSNPNYSVSMAASYTLQEWQRKSKIWNEVNDGFTKINYNRKQEGQIILPCSLWELKIRDTKFNNDIQLVHEYYDLNKLNEIEFIETCVNVLNDINIFWTGLEDSLLILKS